MTYYLAIDIGASSGRHILGSMQNGVLTLEEVYRFENGVFESDNGLVWNIDNLVREVTAGIKKCAEIGKIPKTVAIDTWGVDYVLLDKNQKEILPVFAYRNDRAESILGVAEKCMPFQKLYQKTGIQYQSFNTVYQLLFDKQSGRLDKAEYFLMMPDYLSYKLTDVISNEYTNASTGALLNAFSGEFDDEILSAFGIKKSLFKKPQMPCTPIGEFAKAIADEVGFNAEVIHAPSHDTASAVAACPISKNSVYISSGTWSLIGTENKAPVITNESMKANFTNEGGIEKNYRFLKNIMGMWLFQNIRKNLDKAMTYDEMMHEAMKSKIVIYFDVNDQSLTAPKNMIKAIEKLIGKENMPIGDLLNCTYHSLAKSYQTAIGEIEQITGKTISDIFIVGGGSKDSYLNQLTQQYTEKTVRTGLKEATATGNILSQIMYDKKLNLQAARKIIEEMTR